MARQLVVSWLGTIFDAQMTKTPDVMSANRRDRTDEAIRAVAEHMKCKADCNEEQPGFWQYRFSGIGTLTWQAEKKGEENGE